MPKKRGIILGLIFLFSFLLFTLYSTYVFPTPNWDEVSFGYNAFSILKTGRDEWGNLFPLIFRAFGDYKLPLYAYLSTFSIAILGLNVYAVRLVSILAGSIFPLILFSIARELNFSLKTALFIALISVINPWHLWLSSSALESNLALTLFAGAVLFSIKFFKFPRQYKFFLIATILLGLSMYTYNSYRLIAPLVFLFLVFNTSLTQKILKKTLPSIIIFSLFLLPLIYQTYKGYGRARFDIVSLFKDPGLRLSVEADRNFPHSKLTGRLFHNYPFYLGQKLSFNYLTNFSPEFLFLYGGHNQAFSPPSYGYFYWWEITLWLAGLLILIKALITKFNSSLSLLVFILIISPLPAIITIDGAHSLRSYSLFLPSIILIGLSLDKIKPKKILFLLAGAYLISFFFFNEYAFNHYPRHFDSHWLSAENKAIEYIASHRNKYDKIIIPRDSIDEAYIFYLFYSHLPPHTFWQNSHRHFSHNWYWIDKIGNVYFPDKINSEYSGQKGKKTLLISKKTNKNGRVLAVFKSQDGKTKLEIISFKP